MGSDQAIIQAECIGVITRPWVIVRCNNHGGADGIEFDIAVASQKIALAVHEAGLVATFPESSSTSVGAIEIGNVSPP